ncbi:putative disease resistance protein [Sesamum alatum]|uniref:Disease resistance protein n=1 Tax=Sesamum alatum TaxID=300844 RepID=A0AAE2CJL1_9LAMI|nr:putative disease resistance protein [Sesamum alatum]
MAETTYRGRGETLRDVAERYLFELANRCMIQVKMDERSIYNKFESCRLHDLMREHCLSKAKEEEFLKVVDMQTGEQDESSMCRLAVHLDVLEDDYIRKYQNLRSLLLLGKFRQKSDFKGINLERFKLLKILILEGCRFKNKKLPEGIEKLILLKHLSIKDSEVDELPKSVCKLLCLRSLDLRVDCDLALPNSIHKIRRLRHLFLLEFRRSIIGGGKLKFEGLNELETLIGFSSKLDETTHLLKLSKLQVFHGDVTENESLSTIVDHILDHQDQFREIQLHINDDCNMGWEEGPDLARKMLMCRSLSSLVTWRCVIVLPVYEFELYRNLISLVLWHSNMEKDPMGILEKLPMLRNLELWDGAYVGREMVCRAAGFPQLKNLCLSHLDNLEEWRVEEGAMSNLVHLSIIECKKLKMIPDGLKFITTLESLLINNMSKEFIDRARVVDYKEREDYHKIKHIRLVYLHEIRANE